MSISREFSGIVWRLTSTCAMLLVVANGASAQALAEISSGATDHHSRARALNGPILSAVRSSTWGTTGTAGSVRANPAWNAVATSRPSGENSQTVQKNGRSKLKAMLIGAAIGAGVGFAGGLYAVEAGGDVSQEVIAFLMGIGAGAGAVVGFAVALF